VLEEATCLKLSRVRRDYGLGRPRVLRYHVPREITCQERSRVKRDQVSREIASQERSSVKRDRVSR